MRRNVLIDTGKTVNWLGSKLIETPDYFKRISSEGTIVSIGPKCRNISKEYIGKRCIIDIQHDEDRRIRYDKAVKMGLNPHWHFIIHEDLVKVIII